MLRGWRSGGHVLPHVDEILGQGDTLSISSDGDGSVKVGGGVPVLAVGDTYHGS